jgi:phosphoribosyl 1,2-cyclic phosphodiesterase
MKFSVLGSGSGGNCSVVSCGSTHLLVDAGLSASQIRQRLGLLGLEYEQISGILITHEHQDHARGLEVLLKRHSVPVYTSALTRQVLRESIRLEVPWKLVAPGSIFRHEDVEVDTFPVPHDAVEPICFVLRGRNASLGVVTDAGHVSNMMLSKLRGLNALFVEANYDCDLLEQDDKRPYSTKQRISSQHGHLSNAQAAELLAKIAHSGMERIVLGHLSRDCNEPELACGQIRTALTVAGHPHVEIHCATQDKPTPWLKVRTKAAEIPLGANLVQGELLF